MTTPTDQDLDWRKAWRRHKKELRNIDIAEDGRTPKERYEEEQTRPNVFDLGDDNAD